MYENSSASLSYLNLWEKSNFINSVKLRRGNGKEVKKGIRRRENGAKDKAQRA
jgi:hypothetical protein